MWGGYKRSCVECPSPRRGIDPVPRAARASRGTWTSPLVARTTVTSTTVAGFGR